MSADSDEFTGEHLLDAMMAKGLHEVAAADVPADLLLFGNLAPVGPA